MERKDILEKLNEIFCEVLDVENLVLTEDMSADDIEEWDSLANIQLVVAIEKAFKVKISSIEIRGWENVGDMTDALLKKLS